jgi:protein kinase A
VRIIGTGTFGRVYFATLDEKSYAIKFMSKKKIIELDQVEHINNEKNILASFN